ncbi:MAG TPA: DUF2339 domain-containing protein [Candidatus Eisenbacteria bacterium]|nr:DUF2339 domain-containing protein [Candidatus Eisenbacteria bacterium]
MVVAGIALAIATGARDELRRMRARLEQLERRADAAGAPPVVVVPPAAETPAAAAGDPARGVTPAPAPVLPIPASPPPVPARSFEQLVGGVWLLNAGAVLVLLGVFFLILWGYATGRLGPGVLVAAGVGLGVALVWRGVRTARQVPVFGHGLAGVGVGVVWLSLYLGHFTLRTLDAPATFVALTLVSLGTVVLGLWQCAEAIGALGVAGAFVPLALGAWLPLQGFSLDAHALLAWLLAVDVTVGVLAARAAWGRLHLLALALTAYIWLIVPATRMLDGLAAGGLIVLYALFGLALLPRIAAVRARVGAAEIAVVALAPLALVVSLWGWLGTRTDASAAALLLGLAAMWFGAARWVEPRRVDQDLWRPLTGAGTVFLTAALQRVTGPDVTPIAWTAEGVVLVWLGLARQGGWLRFCGHAVAALGALDLLVRFVISPSPGGAVPFVGPLALERLATIVLLGALALRLGRARQSLPAFERFASRAWTVGVNTLLMVWSAIECGRLAQWLVAGAPVARDFRAPVFTSLAWLLQAVALLLLGWRSATGFRRWLGLALLALVTLKFVFVDLARADVFWRFLVALGAGLVMLALSYLYQRRGRAALSDR